MEPKAILEEAKAINNEVIKNYRFLHMHAEIGFELHETKKFVMKKLSEIGYHPIECGISGISATVGSGNKTILLRADMDALPITEETKLPFSCINGKMHACGHDTHTAMLLGAAKILKAHEKELKGRVKLMFQPSEETFEGALDMITAGILRDPKVDCAMMIHSITGIHFPVGTAIVSSPGVSAPAADSFKITVHGKSCHGSSPHLGIDALIAASNILLSLKNIPNNLGAKATLSIGKLYGGTAANIIADKAVMEGTVRTYDDKTRSLIKDRITKIASEAAYSSGANCDVSFSSGCPTLINDESMSNYALTFTKELIGEKNVLTSSSLSSAPSGGSEDFAYVSQKVPSVMISLAAGDTNKGYKYPQHHPKAKFDESVLEIGTAVYAFNAICYLELQ